MNKLYPIAIAALLGVAAPLAAHADSGHGKDKHAHGKPAAHADMAEGEVRKIDKEAKKITLKHGEIKNLEMPAMTMVFQVSDAAILDKVQAGDKVRFKAEKTGGGYAVTALEPAK